MAETALKPRVLPTDRALILASLLTLAVAAWGILIWQSGQMGDDMSLTMGLSAPLFIALWVAMMVAIMYPTAAPMIMMFAKVHNGKRLRGDAFVPTWIFAGSYILVWSLTGIGAYVLALGGDELAAQSGWISDNASRIGGAVLVTAGVYQLTPVKNVCLGKCRSPMSFMFSNWRDGQWGSFRMGVDHAMFCLGCCWLLFIILFPLGMMNVAALALVTALIFAEKSLPIGRHVARLAAVLLVAYGAFAMFVPDALPTMMNDDGMTMVEMDNAHAQPMAPDHMEMEME